MDTTTNPPTQIDAFRAFTTQVHRDTYPFISPAQLDLSGKSVFITGASKGIGRATALSYAAAGCSRIGISARSPLATLTAEIKAAAAAASRPEPQILAVALDVGSEASVQAAAEAVSRAFGGSLDVLVNNAAHMEPRGPKLGATETAPWLRTVDVNVSGLYLCSRYLLPLVLASETRVVVNVSSIGAVMVWPGVSAYPLSKQAVARLTEYMHADYGADEGLLAVAVHPGAVMTELARGLPEDFHHLLVDTPELAADTLAWLGQRAEGWDWLGGRMISVCWDLEELGTKRAEIEEKDLLKFRFAM